MLDYRVAFVAVICAGVAYVWTKPLTRTGRVFAAAAVFVGVLAIGMLVVGGVR